MKRIALFALLAACGAPPEVAEQTWQDHDLATWEGALNVGAVGGCSTGAVAALTRQLIDELNCIQSGTMVDFRKPNISLGSTVNPFLAPGASTALQQAVNASGTSISIISAYRSVAQQYLLYRWWKAGTCGVPIAALPGRSNHQSGRALDVSSYSSWISRLQATGWKWYGSGDPAHFDYLAAPDFGSRSVLAFQRLWNKNRSNKLVEDGVWGPASESAMAAAPAEGFPVSGCAAPPPAVQTGTLKGKVFVLDPQNPADMSRLVAGATVKVGGQTLTTGADGLYSASLNAGTVTVTATAAGYAAASLSRTVTAGQTTWGSVGLLPVGAADSQPPDLEVTGPADGAAVDLAEVVLEGTASDAQGPLASFTVALNGQAPAAVALAGGAFAHPLKLVPGTNTVVLAAKDGAGNQAKVTLKLSFRAGVEGFVTTEGEAGTPIEGAQVTLLDAQGATVGTVASGPDGAYAFELAKVPGAYTLRASAQGFAPYEARLDVGDDARLVWTIPLVEGDGTPQVKLLSPSDGDVVASESVRVWGVVSGFTPDWVAVNGRKAALAPGGRFEVDVALELGLNSVDVLALRNDGPLLVKTRIVLERVTVEEWVSERQGVRGGCAAVPGAPLWVLGLALLGRLRRRR